MNIKEKGKTCTSSTWWVWCHRWSRHGSAHQTRSHPEAIKIYQFVNYWTTNAVSMWGVIQIIHFSNSWKPQESRPILQWLNRNKTSEEPQDRRSVQRGQHWRQNRMGRGLRPHAHGTYSSKCMTRSEMILPACYIFETFCSSNLAIFSSSCLWIFWVPQMNLGSNISRLYN